MRCRTMSGVRTKLIEARGDKPRSLVARELGITPQALGMIERGQRTPRFSLMQKIADYYGKSVDELFREEHSTCP
ncbi:helix-turn-helix transcriptional regulator [Alicyclobacillus sendaiensis]|uniref:helix-turn-helix transcriptional regulator n=1 Tax=Alicyclobacillus sendaiensis TaxID=192387 RepID=UPI00277D0CAE|nr:helix-turn-helix transcriptional regulator [Alicyclobacillus sendaiensis]